MCGSVIGYTLVTNSFTKTNSLTSLAIFPEVDHGEILEKPEGMKDTKDC